MIITVAFFSILWHACTEYYVDVVLLTLCSSN